MFSRLNSASRAPTRRGRYFNHGVVTGLLAIGTFAPGRAEPQRPGFDVLLLHGTIVDGTGLPRFDADVGVTAGRIARIGNLGDERATVEIDARGLYIAPGFINLHSHPSGAVLPRAENMLTQGVTTEILNPDGGGPLNVADQLARLEAGGLAVNVGAYIGFNTIWSSVVGAADRRPAAADIDQMRALLLDGLRQGAWGVSAGLDYKPAYFARTEEVIDVVSVARPWRTNFTNHDRLTPELKFSSLAGMAETMRIAEAAGMTAVITHMKLQGHEQGSARKVLDLMRASTKRGVYVAADAYPYLAGQTALGALLVPAWAQDGGPQAMRQRFADPEQRARIASEIEQAMTLRFGGADGVYLPSIRKQLTDVMKELQAPAGEAVVRLLEQSNPSAILRFGDEEDLRGILHYADTAIACDCGATSSTTTHPRNYGTYPRVLGRYVRDTGVLTWESAIRKMTALPAATIGMIDRGVLTSGMAADITVFDPQTVIDHATYESPAQLSEGIRHVLVNGRVALRDGVPTGEQGGRALRRTSDMPSRPTSFDVARRVAVNGAVDVESVADATPARVTMDVRQDSRSRTATGRFRLSDRTAGIVIDARTFGVLQTGERWASFTGRTGPDPNGNERSFIVIVDRDPAESSTRSSIRVRVDDAVDYAGDIESGRITISPVRR